MMEKRDSLKSMNLYGENDGLKKRLDGSTSAHSTLSFENIEDPGLDIISH